MATETPSLEEVIATMKTQVYSEYDAERLTISYEGVKVEYEGEVWYQITTSDSSGSYSAFATVIDGDFVDYDGDHLDFNDKIPEIEAILAKRD